MLLQQLPPSKDVNPYQKADSEEKCVSIFQEMLDDYNNLMPTKLLGMGFVLTLRLAGATSRPQDEHRLLPRCMSGI